MTSTPHAEKCLSMWQSARAAGSAWNPAHLLSAAGAGIECLRRASGTLYGKDCTGCGICFYCCPEPGAISVYRLRKPAKTVAEVQPGGRYAAAV